jgi:prepilin-type N-terminal cleavage/methylation domain-containing protein
MTSKHSNGFTLIEVMVALVTMGIALLALCGLQLSSLRADTRNRDDSRAFLLANQTIEELRTKSFLDVSDGEDLTSAAPFAIVWTINAVQPWQKELFVTVSWPERLKLLNATQKYDATDKNYKDKERFVRVATILVDLH